MSNITAKVIQHSKSVSTQKEICTFEVEFPRFILAEALTHRQLSRNTSSSRAIPAKTMLENIRNNPAMPVHWGKNQAGMQAKEELEGVHLDAAKAIWQEACVSSLAFSNALQEHQVHKQITNRLTEPFQTVKMLITATEWNNFFWLRNHADAQPEIAELAKQMQYALDRSVPYPLLHGEWHLPYIDRYNHEDTDALLYFSGDTEVSLEEAKRISASMCAQVSYRKSDDSQEKADKIFKQLIETEPCHASPIEHQACALHVEPTKLYSWQWPEGVTHVDRKGQWWSGNFCGFVQHRQLIPGHTKEG